MPLKSEYPQYPRVTLAVHVLYTAPLAHSLVLTDPTVMIAAARSAATGCAPVMRTVVLVVAREQMSGTTIAADLPPRAACSLGRLNES